MPDLSGVIALSTILSFGHGCPVGPNIALTAQHIVNPEPLDLKAPMVPVQWSQGSLIGHGTPRLPWADRDLASLRSDLPFPTTYVVASTIPSRGEVVYFVGFNWSKKRAFEPREVKAKVIGMVAGQLIYDETAGPGGSGSCVLNAAGEVVAIHVATMNVGPGDNVGIGVLIVGLDVDVLQ